jgi:Gpi18-like mannosyltransferase
MAVDETMVSARPRQPVVHRTWTPARVAVAAAVVLGALAVRLTFFQYQSGDYTAYFGQWYQFIDQHGHFAALKYDFANYNVPYLYLLAILTYTPIPALYGIKLVSVVFDLLLAFFTCRIVALRRPGTWWPLLAAALVLYLPTVVMNSSLWGQADAIYSAFAVGGMYFLLRRRPWLACLFFGLAFSFKLQVIFLFPVLLLLVLRRRVPWRALLLIPGVYLVLDVPALLAGANVHTLLTVYVDEANAYDQLTLNASNAYQFLGTVSDTTLFKGIGIALTGSLLVALILPVVGRRVEMTPTRIVLASAVSAVLVPFFLPAMHERYFYLADTLTVIAAFYLPKRLWALPVLEQFASAFSYAPFLLQTAHAGNGPADGGGFRGATPSGGGVGGGGGGGGVPTATLVSFPILSTAMLAALVLVVWTAIQDFRRPTPVTG